MRKYTKYVFEALTVVVLFAALVLICSYFPIRSTVEESDTNSNQSVMTEMHPHFQEIIENMRQNDPEDVYERFKDEIPPGM